MPESRQVRREGSRKGERGRRGAMPLLCVSLSGGGAGGAWGGGEGCRAVRRHCSGKQCHRSF